MSAAPRPKPAATNQQNGPIATGFVPSTPILVERRRCDGPGQRMTINPLVALSGTSPLRRFRLTTFSYWGTTSQGDDPAPWSLRSPHHRGAAKPTRCGNETWAQLFPPIQPIRTGMRPNRELDFTGLMAVAVLSGRYGIEPTVPDALWQTSPGVHSRCRGLADGRVRRQGKGVSRCRPARHRDGHTGRP